LISRRDSASHRDASDLRPTSRFDSSVLGPCPNLRCGHKRCWSIARSRTRFQTRKCMRRLTTCKLPISNSARSLSTADGWTNRSELEKRVRCRGVNDRRKLAPSATRRRRCNRRELRGRYPRLLKAGSTPLTFFRELSMVALGRCGGGDFAKLFGGVGRCATDYGTIPMTGVRITAYRRD
jgi:hypothetical protein